MLVKLLHDTIVRLKEGTVIELPEEEAKRLMAFGNAQKEKKETKKAKGGK